MEVKKEMGEEVGSMAKEERWMYRWRRWGKIKVTRNIMRPVIKDEEERGLRDF